MQNFGVVLAKSLLKGTPAHWERHRRKAVESLVAIRERRSNFWPNIRGQIVRLLNSLEPAHRERAIAFLATFPDFLPTLDEPVKTALRETVTNMQPSDVTDYRIFSAMRLSEFRPALEKLVAGLTADQLSETLASEPYQELWPRALDAFSRSGSFRGAEVNFRELISPFSGRLDSVQLGALLEAIMGNGQIWDAAETPSLLLALLKDAKRSDLPKYHDRDEFLKLLKHHSRVARYDDVLELFKARGWTPGADSEAAAQG